MTAVVESSADVAEDAQLGDGTRIWHLAQVREGAELGAGCIVGRGAYIGTGVRLGDHCKIQNYALVYEPAQLGQGVFVGPAAVLTNDQYPRAVNADFSPKSAHDWEAVGVTIRDGAAIGARAVCVAPVTIGRWALVAAGAVVTRDVPDFACVAGVPAKRVAWVGKAGRTLVAEGGGRWRCPETGSAYVESGDSLREAGDERDADPAGAGSDPEADPATSPSSAEAAQPTTHVESVAGLDSNAIAAVTSPASGGPAGTERP